MGGGGGGGAVRTKRRMEVLLRSSELALDQEVDRSTSKPDNSADRGRASKRG